MNRPNQQSQYLSSETVIRLKAEELTDAQRDGLSADRRRSPKAIYKSMTKNPAELIAAFSKLRTCLETEKTSVATTIEEKEGKAPQESVLAALPKDGAWQLGRFSEGEGFKSHWQFSEPIDAIAWNKGNTALYALAPDSGTIFTCSHAKVPPYVDLPASPRDPAGSADWRSTSTAGYGQHSKKAGAWCNSQPMEISNA